MKKILIISIIGLLILSGIGVSSLPFKKTNSVSTSADGYDMVIIAPETFSNALQSLIDHKNSVGIKTFLKTTENIYSSYNGRDKPEQIKYCIKDIIETYNITYVLLVGGRIKQSFKWYIPPRYSHVDDGFLEKEIISDLYYADIYKKDHTFEDWDSNGNGIYAEWIDDNPVDSMDLIPDISLGRLPCRNIGEVEDIVQKIINYENNAYEKNWFNNILLVGGDTNPGVGDPFPFEGEEECEWVLKYLDGFIPTRLYVSDESLSGPDNFISAFNKGNGFVYFAGHGLPDELKTFLPNSSEEVQVFHNKYISELNNNDMFPITIVGCCATTNYDVGILDFLRIFKNMARYHHFSTFKHFCVSDCIGWNMVKKTDGGSIAHIGSSSTAWGEVGDKNTDGIPDGVQTGLTSGLCTEFFRIFGEEEKTIIGDIFSETLTNIIHDFTGDFSGEDDRIQCKCIQEFQLIGDPSLKIGGYAI